MFLNIFEYFMENMQEYEKDEKKETYRRRGRMCLNGYAQRETQCQIQHWKSDDGQQVSVWWWSAVKTWWSTDPHETKYQDGPTFKNDKTSNSCAFDPVKDTNFKLNLGQILLTIDQWKILHAPSRSVPETLTEMFINTSLSRTKYSCKNVIKHCFPEFQLPVVHEHI